MLPNVMKTDGSINLVFAGRERKFRLGLSDLQYLQMELGIGPFPLFDALTNMIASPVQVEAVVTRALISGGMVGDEEQKAIGIVKSEMNSFRVDGSGKFLRHVLLASQIMHHAIGPNDVETPPEVKKDEALSAES